MRIRERYELAEEVTTRYQGAGRVEKGQRLDSFCLASGYGRKYAVKVLRGRRRLPLRKRVPRTRRYGPGFRAALKVCWEASDYLCPQRLQHFLGDLVLILGRHGQPRCSRETRQLLATASVSAVERHLREFRRVVVGKWRELDVPPVSGDRPGDSSPRTTPPPTKAQSITRGAGGSGHAYRAHTSLRAALPILSETIGCRSGKRAGRWAVSRATIGTPISPNGLPTSTPTQLGL